MPNHFSCPEKRTSRASLATAKPARVLISAPPKHSRPHCSPAHQPVHSTHLV